MYSPEKPAPTITASSSAEGVLFELAGIGGHGNADVRAAEGSRALRRGPGFCGNSPDTVPTVTRLWP
jgi:hypothetical protein